MSSGTQIAALRALLSDGKPQKLPKKHPITFSDERVFLLILDQGYVIRYGITSEGERSIQSVYGPDQVFPLTPVFKTVFDMDIYKGQETFYYETITPITYHCINKAIFSSALQSNPDLYKDLLYVAGQRLESNIYKLESTSLKTANKRLSHLLLNLANKFGEKNGQTVTIKLPLTHELLSEMLDFARETVSICMSRLHEKGVIEAGRSVVIKDIEALEREYI